MISIEALENWIASDAGRLMRYRIDVLVIGLVVMAALFIIANTWGKKYDARRKSEEVR